MIKSILNFLKQFFPPILLTFIRSILINKNYMWSGDFNDWDEANLYCTGYDDEIILRTCKESLLQVKNGKAVYERDGVLFDKVQYSWPLITYLFKTAVEFSGNLSVLDFGGSLGSSYFQNRALLGNKININWGIVEQPSFVAEGRKSFESDELKFYDNLEACVSHINPNILVLSSVLQYLPDPYGFLKKMIDLRIKYIVLDRTAFTVSDKDLLTIQTVPKEIYPAKYPSWFLRIEEIRRLISEKYIEVACFDSYCEQKILINNGKSRCYWKGLIFSLK